MLPVDQKSINKKLSISCRWQPRPSRCPSCVRWARWGWRFLAGRPPATTCSASTHRPSSWWTKISQNGQNDRSLSLQYSTKSYWHCKHAFWRLSNEIRSARSVVGVNFFLQSNSGIYLILTWFEQLQNACSVKLRRTPKILQIGRCC